MRPRRKLRTITAALSTAAAATLALAMAPSGTAATTHEPILFIHGWSENSLMWTNFKSRFALDGWSSGQLYTIDYNTRQSNKITAEEVKAKIDQIRAANGGSKVDVITHSMGGLNSRWYLKFMGGTDAVDDWVSLGGPNHGTWDAAACAGYSYASCIEMLPGSSFLNQLNADDETPGAVNYGTWWSPCDEVIIPQESVILSGARNTKTACLEHIYLSQDDTVYQGVREFVR